MKRIFVSYARADKSTVSRFVKALEVLNYEVFWDFDLPTGSSWNDHIHRELVASDLVLVIWSRNSVNSDFVKEEANRARLENKLMPVLIDDATIPFGFGQIQATDMTAWNGSINDDRWLILSRSIKGRLQNGKEGDADPDVATSASDRGGLGFAGLGALILCAALMGIILYSIAH